MPSWLSNFWSDALAFAPKLLWFLVILLVGFIVASLLERGTEALVSRFRNNRFVTSVTSRLGRGGMRLNIADVLSKVVYWLVVLFTLYFAFGVFGADNAVVLLLASIIAFLPKLFVALILVVIAFAVASIVRGIVVSALNGLSYARTVGNIAGGFIVVLGVIAALTQVGIAVVVTTALLWFLLATISGILIVGVGGGLIGPMRERLGGWLDDAEDEIDVVVDVVDENAPAEPELVPVDEGVVVQTPPTPKKSTRRKKS